MSQHLLKNLDFRGFDTAVLTLSHDGALSCREDAFAAAYNHVFGSERPKGDAVGLRLTGPAPVKNLILVPLSENPSHREVEKGFAKAASEAAALGAKQVLLALCDTLSPALTGKAYESVLLAGYRFQNYLGEKKDVPVFSIHSTQAAQAQVAEGALLARVTGRARDLVNEPANVMTPAALAKAAQEVGAAAGFEVQVLEPAQIASLGMDAFLTVGRGGANTPRLIAMRYQGAPGSDRRLALVGKGLTYDSGGYNLKPGDGMATMKCDMGGAAAVIGAMEAIVTQKLPLNVVGVIAACENMISGEAYRAGDIIGTMAGKTVEVLNTDAEGRLTLVDAITYAIRQEKATELVDIATLTGAAVVALGEGIIPTMASDDALYDALEAASAPSCEKIWRLPCDEDLAEGLKSPIADLKNVAGRAAGTITAGLFIKAFAEELPWAHLDIAGPSFVQKDTPLCPTGGTGSGTRLLYHMAKARAQQA